MLEPRRLAASTIAHRMASLLGEPVGETVGYRIRFENRVSSRTRVEILTEGILTRMVHRDSSLEDVGLVIFDEFHERSIHADIAMALCREIQSVLRPDMRIMVMSATMDMPHLSKLLDAPIVESKGKQFPVEVIYMGDSDERMLPEMATNALIQIVKESKGDILVFLPGKGEIKKCEALLKNKLKGFVIHPLFGQLPPSKQYAALMPNRTDRRKIVLATSIAETSLTIEGITTVLDSGFGRSPRFDPRSGLSKLTTQRISKDSADQRAGRAGRLGPGTCYRMWTKATHERMVPFRSPEILEADLAPLVLDMTSWGIKNISEMTWLSPPPLGSLNQAYETLRQLNAIENGQVTVHGKRIHQLPCHPRIAHMLLMAEEIDKPALATDIAALLEEKDPLDKESGIDINLRLEALRRHRKEGRKSRAFDKIEKVASSYRKLLYIDQNNDMIDPYETGILLAYAYPERIAYARPGANAQFQLANGKLAMANHRDDLAHEPWIAIAHIDAREGMGKIFMAAPLNPKDLAPLVKEVQVIDWDTKKGGLVAIKELRIGSILLQATPLVAPDRQLVAGVISDAIRQAGDRLLNWNEEVIQWQNRVSCLSIWRPEESWPDVSTKTLLRNNEGWLALYLQNITRVEELKKLGLLKILQASLDYRLQTELDRLAPIRIEVPSGSTIKLKYKPNGEPPVLSVRLQEIFGLADTPLINEGRTPVILHLLSPGFKPVQITTDLRSFWNNTYFEVKKELKRRYPKHAWPDDPWTAKAIRGVGRGKK